MSVEKLAHALLESGLVDATTVEARASRSRGGRMFLETLVLEGDVTEPALVNQLARSLSVPRYDPKERHPEPDALAALDLRSADELGVIPVAVRGGGSLLWVAMCDPTDENLAAEIARRSRRRVKACVIGPRELTRALNQLKGAPPTPAVAAPAYPAAAPYPAPVPNPMPMYGQVPLPAAPMPPLSVAQMQAYGYGYGAMPAAPPSPAPASGTPLPVPAGKSPEMQKLEEELAQAKQVVKVLVQLLVETGLLNGEELKRRLRAERDRK